MRWILIAAVLAFGAKPLLGQTTRPLSNAEIVAKANAMNKRAAAQRGSVAERPEMAANRQNYLRGKQYQAEAELRLVQKFETEEREAQQARPEVAAKFATVQRQGQAAEARLTDLLRKYQIGLAFA